MEQTKKVLSRRKKKASKGRVVRISDPLFDYLNRKRVGRQMSWDAFLRQQFNIPDRSGSQDSLMEGWTFPGSTSLYPTKEKAHAASVLHSASRGRKLVERPVKLRQLP